MPALSSTTLPNLLDAIDHLQLSTPPPSEQEETPKEHEDLLESLAVKDTPKPSSFRENYQKFLNVLGEQPSVQNPNPALEPLDPTPEPNSRNPPFPPGHVDPLPNPGIPRNSNWEPRKIPTTDKDPKKVFTYRNPLYNNTSALIPKVSNPILPFIHRDPKTGNGRPMECIQGGSGEVLPPPLGVTPMDHPKGDPPAEKEEETSSQKVAKISLPMANLKIVDVVKSKKNTASWASKCKEPDTQDLGSGGASAPLQK